MLELIAADISENNLTFELEHDAEIIAHQTGINWQRIQEMMAYMITLGLFENASGTITCLKLLKRLDQSMTSNPKMRKFITEAKNHHDPIMTPSGRNHDSVMQEEKRIEENRKEDIKDMSTLEASTPPPAARIPFEKIKDLYHTILPNHPRVNVITDKRKGFIRQSWKNYLDSLDQWEAYFKNSVTTSDFLAGRATPAPGRRPFQADFDWLINQNNIVKVSEGKYHG